MGSFAILAIMAGLFGMAFMDMADISASDTDAPAMDDDGSASSQETEDSTAGDLLDNTSDTDESPAADDEFPVVAMMATANADGGLDYEINLSTAEAEALLAENATLSVTTMGETSGWFTANGEEIADLEDLGTLGANDNVNVNVPEDFPYQIIPTLQLHNIDGPGMDFIDISLGVFTDVDMSPASGGGYLPLDGGPLAAGDGFLFEGIYLLEDSPAELGQIDDWMAEAATLAGVSEAELVFEQFENGAEAFISSDFGERTFETRNGNIPFIAGSILPSGGTEENGVTFTPLTTTIDVTGTAYLVEMDDKIGVVFLADNSVPADLAAEVFSVNGAPITDFQYRPVYS